MRITNTMISDNAAMNINGNKISVDANNTRMTTQKKIDRPSEDPVIAIRSLRLQTSLNKINQYYEKNIPDAQSWMDVTETALLNIRDIMTDVRTLCVQGATDTLTEDDRNTIYNQLKKFQEQVYAEGNADYAGRTVFTGFRTDKDLAFMTEEKKTTYKIEEPLEAVSMTKSRFYTNNVKVPATADAVKSLIIEDGGDGKVDPSTMTIEESDYYKLRLSYNLTNPDEDSVTAINFYDKVLENGNDILVQRTSYPLQDGEEIAITDDDGNVRYATSYDPPTTYTDTTIKKVYQFDNETDWANWSKKQVLTTQDDSGNTVTENVTKKYVPDGAVVIIKDTGDIVFADDVANTVMTAEDTISFDYEKTGFQKGELKPEYYFDSWLMIDKDGNDMGVKELKYYEQVSDTTDKDPSEEGWYVLEDGEYILTADTTPASGRVYYTKSDVPVVREIVEYNAVTNTTNSNPKERGWYEQSGDTYVLTTDTEPVSGKTYYNKKTTESTYLPVSSSITGIDPSAEGWYELDSDGEYVLTTDTTIDSSKSYYYNTLDLGYSGLQYDRYEKSTREVENASGETEDRKTLVKMAAYSLDYTVAQNQKLGVNLEAEQCFNHDIYQDMSDMINAVGWSQSAHDKVDKIKAMMEEDQYQSDTYQKKLTKWLEIANKEMDYYDNNLSKLYSTTLGKIDTYLDKINLSITDLGCRVDQLNLTEKRMSEQQDTVEELRSQNDNLDLSQIIMDYTSSYTAYQSSLIAAGKLGEQTLLNYI